MNEKYADLIMSHLQANYLKMIHPPTDKFTRPYIVAGGGYETCMWDWDSFFASVSLFRIMDMTSASDADRAAVIDAMKGNILNFLDFQLPSGAIPHSLYVGAEHLFAEMIEKYDEPNMHKPVFAQFVHMVVEETGDTQWIADRMPDIARFMRRYDEKYYDDRTGLYFWRSGAVIGVDNDPCTFGRPKNSSASVYLNCLMIKELDAMARLWDTFGDAAAAEQYRAKKTTLTEAIQKYLWDKRDCFFYSADLQCQTDKEIPWLNSGMGVFWPCLPMRIQVWTGFMPLWAGAATPQQAHELVEKHLYDTEALCSDYGMRTLAANEPMYNCDRTSNPSNWLGPIWLISNYMIFQGLYDYGYHTEAADLCARIVNLLGRDIEENGAMHEYYIPETGIGVMNPGFMNWNYLVANMIDETRKMNLKK
jgi:putative isomerase